MNSIVHNATSFHIDTDNFEPKTKNINDIDGIIDSGATDFIFPNANDLTNYKPHNSFILLADKITKLPIVGIGDYGLLKNVLVCPSLKNALLSTTKLSKINLSTLYHRNKVYLLNDYIINDIALPIAIAKLQKDNLYHVHNLKSLKNYQQPPTSIINNITYTTDEIKNGSSRTNYSATHANLDPLEWLHVRLAHINEHLIKHIVKHDIVLGLGVTYDQIKNQKLKICDACTRGKMKALTLPYSISHTSYGIFEYISLDIIFFPIQSYKHYTCSALYMDKCTNKIFAYHMKLKSELLNTFKQLINDNNHHKNPKSLTIRILQSDFEQTILSSEFITFLQTNNIEFQSSAPYKHAQNPIERFISTIKNGLRTIMIYNKAPVKFWDYALDYYIHTYNHLPQINKFISRNEEFTGIKSDLSNTVPFYASGYYHVSDSEKQSLKLNKTLTDKSRQCKFLGYADNFKLLNNSSATIHFKNSYICLTAFNTIIVRHDCYFRHYTNDSPSLLNQ
jgi:hypothetical protein